MNPGCREKTGMRRIVLGAAPWVALPAAASAQSAAWASDAKLESSRTEADSVVVAFIELATQPRGERGLWPANGHVAHVERGTRLKVGDPISARVPCAVSPERESKLRKIAMRNMRPDSWARLYFSGRELVDYQPLELVPADRQR